MLSLGTVILVALPILALLLDVVYDWLSQGRLPAIIPRLTIASLAQGSSVLATLLLVTTKTWSGQFLAIIFLALFFQLLILIFCGALVQQARRLTQSQVRKVLEERVLTSGNSIESTTLNSTLELASELVVEDLHPHNVRSQLSGEDNSQRRELFLRIAGILVKSPNHDVKGDELLLPEKTRLFFARLYGVCGIVSFVLFFVLLILAGTTQ